MRDADRATDGPEDAVVAHLTNRQLLECVQQLGSEQQECIVLRFLHGLSVSETAEIMGKKDGAIKALQHRAVRRLAGCSRRVCDDRPTSRFVGAVTEYRARVVGSDAAGCPGRDVRRTAPDRTRGPEAAT